ncbi:hypothetical protein [uncultured Campylobacter sp.]|uniref:hypothetical protein n=1 Tax=uncultured Campylobacter sp. TaxID=218934 RepID=UPI00262DE99C|nr:hypothetical protein [uncultured Campylobacter sp.]
MNSGIYRLTYYFTISQADLINIFGSHPDLGSRIKAIKTSKFPKRKTEPPDRILTKSKGEISPLLNFEI